MQIKYRFTFSWEASRGEQLRALGLTVEEPQVPPGFSGIGVSHVDEGAAGWAEACSLVKLWRGGIDVSTEFTKEEIVAADYCIIRGAHYGGYPQPESDEGYQKITYSSACLCPDCGVGLEQIAPFRMRKSIRFGRNAFLYLYWVHDQIFMPHGTWEKHLAPLCVGALPVNDVKGQPMEGVIQLKVEQHSPLHLDVEGEVCGICGRKKFLLHDRGYAPHPVDPPACPIFRSSQHFGAGAQAFNRIVVRSDVAAEIVASGLKGARLIPCFPRSV